MNKSKRYSVLLFWLIQICMFVVFTVFYYIILYCSVLCCVRLCCVELQRIACLYFVYCLAQARRRGGAGGSRRPSCLSVGGAGGAKVLFLNAMICFLIVNMIQRRSYKLKASNI